MNEIIQNEYEQEDQYEYDPNDSYHQVKKHMSKLQSFNFNKEIEVWIENEINNVGRRIHKYSDEILSAYVILAHVRLGHQCDIDHILEVMGTIKKKKTILDLISGVSTKNSPLQYVSIKIPVMVIYPHELIDKVIENYSSNFSLSNVVEDIKEFTRIICESDRTILNLDPKAAASAFVFFYISNFSGRSEKMKPLVVQTNFKNIKFGSNQKRVNPKSFNECLSKITNIYIHACECLSNEEMQLLLMKNIY